MRVIIRACLLTLVATLSARVAMADPAWQARPNPAVRKPAAAALSPVAVDTDIACTLSIDGENQGELPANGSKTFELTAGEHVLRAASTEDPSIVWRQVIEVTGQRKAALIELAPLLERKRAADAERIRAEQQARADAQRKAADAETARLDQLRLAEQVRRENAAEEQRAAAAERVRLEAVRVELEKATALDAARARSDDEKRFSTALLIHGVKQAQVFHIVATSEGGRAVLNISGPEGRGGLGLVDRQGKPAFRFEVQRARGKGCPGLLFVGRTQIAYEPTAADCKPEAFDLLRTSIQKLRVDGESPKIEFEGGGHDYHLVFLAEETATQKLRGGRSLLLEVTSIAGSLTDSGTRMTVGSTGIAMREWFKVVMLDFEGAQKAFERQTADLHPPTR